MNSFELTYKYKIKEIICDTLEVSSRNGFFLFTNFALIVFLAYYLLKGTIIGAFLILLFIIIYLIFIITITFIRVLKINKSLIYKLIVNEEGIRSEFGSVIRIIKYKDIKSYKVYNSSLYLNLPTGLCILRFNPSEFNIIKNILEKSK